jgi:acyl carrier protein
MVTLREFEDVVAQELVESPDFASGQDIDVLIEWNSLNLMIIASVVVQLFGSELSNKDIRSCRSMEEIYELAKNKSSALR